MITKTVIKKIIAWILLVLLIAYAVVAVLPRPKNYEGENPMMKDGDLPILIAHGGGNKEFPDNTFEAFCNAYSVDERVMMETDVSITKDGVIILSHDTTLDRKTNVTGEIKDWNYTDLIAQKIDFGYTNPTKNEKLIGDRVKFKNPMGKTVTPLDVEYKDGINREGRDDEVFLATTLEELLIAFPNNRINVEIKQSGDTGKRAFLAVLELLRKYDAFDRVVLASFHDEIYNLFREYQRKGLVPDNFMYSPAIMGVVKFYGSLIFGLDIFFRDGICVFQLPTDDYYVQLGTKTVVDYAHKHNIAVHYWTINDKDEMHRLISIGADGIMTDYPHRLAEVYVEYSEKKSD